MLKNLMAGGWGRRWGVVVLSVIMSLIAGCGAQDLYVPPEAPYEIISHLSLPSEIQGVSVYGDVAYVAAGEAGLIAVDFANPRAPVQLTMLNTYKFAEAVGVATVPYPSGPINIAFVVEGTEGITAYDVTDPLAVQDLEQGTTAVDGNGLFVEPSDNADEFSYVYLAENWKGLRVFHTDPDYEGLLQYDGAFCYTRGYAKAVVVDSGYAYVADNQMGLAVADVRTPVLGAVRLVSSCDTRGESRDVALYDGHIFIADGDNGLVVMEAPRDPSTGHPMPEIIGHLELEGFCNSIVVSDAWAYIAAEDGGVHIVDVIEPSAPQSLGRVITSYANGVALAHSGTIVVSDRDEGLFVLEGPDRVPPAAVEDLTAIPFSMSTVRLVWTAPGNDGTAGIASRYAIRYSTEPILTMEDWEAATRVSDLPRPSLRGETDCTQVTGLSAATEYHFAIRTADKLDNWSELSNTPTLVTPDANVAPYLKDGRVTPPVGLFDVSFTFEVTYVDGDGDPATVMEVTISGTTQEMTAVSGQEEGTCEGGTVYRYVGTPGEFEAGAYEYVFTFSDGVNDPVSTEVVAGPYVGDVIMGSPATESGRDSTDEVQHPVVFERWHPRDLWISSHEITRAEYGAVMHHDPSEWKDDDPDSLRPVHNVTWLDAIDYCIARSLAEEGLTPAYTRNGETVTWDREANGYRLPTEAEWEWICRAGSQTAFATGDITEEADGYDPVLDALGWYKYNSRDDDEYVIPKPHQVETKQGVEIAGTHPETFYYDLHGNVAEWCWDEYEEDLGTDLAIDPEGGSDNDVYRVVKGGSWDSNARDCRSAAREGRQLTSADDYVGFRVVRNDW